MQGNYDQAHEQRTVICDTTESNFGHKAMRDERLPAQMAKIDKFTKSQLSILKKRVKTLREQVKDVKEGEGSSKLTQVP